MFTVMIVEDEMLVRIGLKSIIHWEELDMRVVADVPNGQAAWEAYQEENPDIILTDIKMPVMDGLQLISKIRENDWKTKIVILTCFEEFDLVHQALKLGVSDYILKLKMSTGEMESVLKKVKENLMKEHSLQPAKHEIELENSIVNENIIKDYIFYNRFSDMEFAETVQKLKLRIEPDGLIMCSMRINLFYMLQEELEDKQGKLVRFTLLNIITELLDEFNRGEVVYEKDENYLFIFSFHDVHSQEEIWEILKSIFERINSAMNTYIKNISATFGISRMYQGYSHLKDMYDECKALLEQSYFMGEIKYIRWNDVNKSRLLLSMQTKLQNMVKEAKMPDEDYDAHIMEGINSLKDTSCLSRKEIQKLFLRWIHWPTVYAKVDRDTIYRIGIEFADKIHQGITLEEDIEIFKQYLLEVAKCRKEVKCLSKEVAGAVKFIQKNYNQEITLLQVADYVGMSPNYLSSLFKKDLTLSFVEYLNKVRINKAKELLLNTNLKLYHIAFDVGFNNESYFIRIFKKNTGMRPNEFRKQWYIDAEGDEDES